MPTPDPYKEATKYHKALDQYRQQQAVSAQRHAYAAQAWREYSRAVQYAKTKQAAARANYEAALEAQAAAQIASTVPVGAPPVNSTVAPLPPLPVGVAPAVMPAAVAAPAPMWAVAPVVGPGTGTHQYIDAYFAAAREHHRAQLDAASRWGKARHAQALSSNYYYRGAHDIFRLRMMVRKEGIALKHTREDAAWLQQKVEAAAAVQRAVRRDCLRARLVGKTLPKGKCGKATGKRLAEKVGRARRLLNLVAEESNKQANVVAVLKAHLYASELHYFGKRRMQAMAKRRARAAEIEAAVAPLRKQLRKLERSGR